MKNKALQEERMRGYFIEATKELLKAEGLKSVSVRSIADKAGYSYTTMYNYFKDANELIFHCVEDFQEECKTYVDRLRKSDGGARERLRSVVIAYAGYFVEYPGIFELFFLEPMGDFGYKKKTLELITGSFEQITRDDWDQYGEQTQMKSFDLEFLMEQMRYFLTGAMLLYLNRRNPESYTDFMEMLNNQFDIIIE